MGTRRASSALIARASSPFYDKAAMRLKRCGHHIGTRTCILPVGHDGIHIARG